MIFGVSPDNYGSKEKKEKKNIMKSDGSCYITKTF